MRIDKNKLFRALMIMGAMMFIHVASTEATLYGAIDRIIQFIMATAFVYFALK